MKREGETSGGSKMDEWVKMAYRTTGTHGFMTDIEKDVLEKRLEEGYEEIAFGRGAWVGEHRIVGIYAFYHPDGRIATYENPKFMGGGYGMHAVRAPSFEAEYTREGFAKHIKKHAIRFDKKKNLGKVVRTWESTKQDREPEAYINLKISPC